MASLREKSGHYYARFYDSNRSPKQKEKALRTTRKRVARKRLVKSEKAYEEGEFDPWRGGWLIENDTVPGAIERFLDRKRRDGLQESTVEAYEYKLNAFAERTPGHHGTRRAAGSRPQLRPRSGKRGTGE